MDSDGVVRPPLVVMADIWYFILPMFICIPIQFPSDYCEDKHLFLEGQHLWAEGMGPSLVPTSLLLEVPLVPSNDSPDRPDRSHTLVCSPREWPDPHKESWIWFSNRLDLMSSPDLYSIIRILNIKTKDNFCENDIIFVEKYL